MLPKFSVYSWKFHTCLWWIFNFLCSIIYIKINITHQPPWNMSILLHECGTKRVSFHWCFPDPPIILSNISYFYDLPRYFYKYYSFTSFSREDLINGTLSFIEFLLVLPNASLFIHICMNYGLVLQYLIVGFYGFFKKYLPIKIMNLRKNDSIWCY